ncbi:hypothetical protein HDU85_001923 [Gaertneriomyces sp. JEL0708]|nr:hypothetical protein HDU85_001923 [Gaertneriomyces sp. JEL0708]
MFGLNLFRTTVLLLLGSLYYYLNYGTPYVERGLRAPVAVEQGDGVSIPRLAQQFPRGGQIDIKYRCSIELEYLNVDLITVQGGQRFVDYLVTNGTAPNPDGENTLTVIIPGNIPAGSNYVVKVWGPLKGQTESPDWYELPISEMFSIVDPNAGSFTAPGLSTYGYTQWFTGRKVLLQYTLGSAFNDVTAVRIDILNSAWAEVYTLFPSVPASGKEQTYTQEWLVPASLRLSQFYSLRIIPADGLTKTHNVDTQTLTVSPMLSSPLFSIFPQPAMSDPAMTIEVAARWTPGNNTVISWKYAPFPDATVNSWTVELYDTLLGSSNTLGTPIGKASSTNGGRLTYQVPENLAAGVYYIRAWGYATSQNATANAAIDPVSGLSRLIVVLDEEKVHGNILTVTTPSQWAQGKNASVSWTLKQTTDAPPVHSWRVDLYKYSVVHKHYLALATALPAETRSLTYELPKDFLLGTDYLVRVSGSLPENAEVAVFTSAVAVVERLTTSGGGKNATGTNDKNADPSQNPNTGDYLGGGWKNLASRIDGKGLWSIPVVGLILLVVA